MSIPECIMQTQAIDISIDNMIELGNCYRWINNVCTWKLKESNQGFEQKVAASPAVFVPDELVGYLVAIKLRISTQLELKQVHVIPCLVVTEYRKRWRHDLYVLMLVLKMLSLTKNSASFGHHLKFYHISWNWLILKLHGDIFPRTDVFSICLNFHWKIMQNNSKNVRFIWIYIRIHKCLKQETWKGSEINVHSDHV